MLKLLRGCLVVCGVLLFAQTVVAAPEYQYISAEETAKIIQNKDEKFVIMDIQVKDSFDKEHLKGAIPTYAYPVKSDKEKEAVKNSLSNIKEDQKIIVVCPRGKGGATSTISYLVEEVGLDPNRLYILENGQTGWPREQLNEVLEKN